MTPLSRRDGTPVVGIAGWKKSGKTTLAVRLIAELTARGYRIATVKHAHHKFQIDDAETDSARHRRAGAQQIAIVSQDRWAIVRELNAAPEPDLEDVIEWLEPCDLVLVEGYKTAAIRKIEARRQESFDRIPLADGDPLIFAIATDQPFSHPTLPVVSLDDIAAIADLIVATAGLHQPRHEPVHVRKQESP